MKKYRAYLFKSPIVSSKGAYYYFGKSYSNDKYWANFLKKNNLKRKDLELQTWIFNTQEELTEFCLEFSKKANITKSKIFFNQKPENGIDGWGTGESNPTHYMTEEQNKKKGNAFRGKKRPEHAKAISGENNGTYGKNEHTYGLLEWSKKITNKTYDEIFGEEYALELKNKLSISQTGKKHVLKEVKCPHCCLSGAGPNMTRYHFDNCYINPNNIDNKIGLCEELLDYRKKEHKCTICCAVVKNNGNLNRWHNTNCSLLKNIGSFEIIECPTCGKRVDMLDAKKRGNFKTHIKNCVI